MDVAVVVVHYQTPALAADAVQAVLDDAGRAGVSVEGVIVDNGSDAAGRGQLSALPFRLLDPGRNLGFAGGVNLGVASTRAARIVVMNPDVVLVPGCLARLLEALQSDAEIAGPRFFWDRERRLVLPPAERRDRAGELLALLATRSRAWARRARRRWRRHARAHWRARQPRPGHDLSGSLLAFRRETWRRVGPFDDAYPLYFEETDWLLRARRRGARAVYLPAAEAIHLHGRSAAIEPASQSWFEASAARFRERHYGAWFVRLLAGLAKVLGPGSPSASVASREAPDLSRYHSPAWIEVSPNATGYPAAAERLPAPAAGWSLPAEVATRLAGETLDIRLVDDRGRELAFWRQNLPA